MSIQTVMYVHVCHHILHEEEINRRINTSLAYGTRWIRVIFQQFRDLLTQSPLIIPKVYLLVHLGTLSPYLLLLFQIFCFIVTYALIHICFSIAPMISKCPEEVSLLPVATDNTVVEPHLCYGVSCRLLPQHFIYILTIKKVVRKCGYQ